LFAPLLKSGGFPKPVMERGKRRHGDPPDFRQTVFQDVAFPRRVRHGSQVWRAVALAEPRISIVICGV
jgi:hypothetical protein